MKITKQARREAKALFRACQVDGLLDEARARAAVTAVINRKPRGYPGVLAHFQRLVKIDLERRTARVENAVESSPALMAALEAGLRRHYGPGLQLSYWVNPALIAGLRLKVGSDVYDGSVLGRLAALRNRLS